MVFRWNQYAGFPEAGNGTTSEEIDACINTLTCSLVECMFH